MLGKNGPIVKVKWRDCAQQIKVSQIDIKEPSNHLSYCQSIGEKVADDGKALILVQHWSDVDGVDILAIPWDQCIEVEELKCISENSESQQEQPAVTQQRNQKRK